METHEQHETDNEVKTPGIDEKYGLRKWVFNLVWRTIAWGLIVPYIAEVILTIWFPGAATGLNTWNQFVSIILGVVATILSIVSMIMSFKNYDDTLAIQEKYSKELEEARNTSAQASRILESVDMLRNDIRNVYQNSASRSDTSTANSASEWGNGEPPEQKNNTYQHLKSQPISETVCQSDVEHENKGNQIPQSHDLPPESQDLPPDSQGMQKDAVVGCENNELGKNNDT